MAEEPIVVLVRILEDLLERAGATLGIDDAVGGHGEEPVLADAVLEVFRDMGGERAGGLVTIEPGGNGDARAGFFVRLRMRQAGSIQACACSTSASSRRPS